MTQLQEVKTKVVYTIVERQEKSRWVRIGIGFVNRDGSINVRLDAVPVNGKLHLRDYKRKDDETAVRESASVEVGSGSLYQRDSMVQPEAGSIRPDCHLSDRATGH